MFDDYHTSLERYMWGLQILTTNISQWIIFYHFPNKCHLGAYNGSKWSWPKNMSKILNCATIKENQIVLQLRELKFCYNYGN